MSKLPGGTIAIHARGVSSEICRNPFFFLILDRRIPRVFCERKLLLSLSSPRWPQLVYLSNNFLLVFLIFFFRISRYNLFTGRETERLGAIIDELYSRTRFGRCALAWHFAFRIFSETCTTNPPTKQLRSRISRVCWREFFIQNFTRSRITPVLSPHTASGLPVPRKTCNNQNRQALFIAWPCVRLNGDLNPDWK